MTESLEKDSSVNNRNGRMMVLAGTALCGGLVIGTVAAAAGGVAPGTDVATTRSRAPISALAQAVAEVAGRPPAPGVVSGPLADAGAIVAAAVAGPVTVAPLDGEPAPDPTAGAAGEAAAVVLAAPPASATTAPAASTAVAEVPAAPVEVAAAPDPEPAAPAPEAPAPPAAEATVAAPPPAPTGSSVEAAIQAWFPDVYDQALRVAACESSLNPGAVSRGGGNHGLFQINNVHRRNFEAVTGQPWSMVYDAYYNSQYARRLYDGSGWRPWTCRP